MLVTIACGPVKLQCGVQMCIYSKLYSNAFISILRKEEQKNLLGHWRFACAFLFFHDAYPL